MIIIYITCKDDKEADIIAQHLVQKRLIACANIFPIRSIYRWKEDIAAEKEVALLAKSARKNYEKIKKEVKKMHSYKVPCIIKINAEANKEYEKWINEEVK